jgi:hypothetical protein
MTQRLILALVVLTSTASAVDYKSQIAPIFRAKCFDCHSETKKVKGKLALDDGKLPDQIGPGKNIVPSKPEQSTLYIDCGLPDDDEAVMPPKGKNRLTQGELDLLKGWIAEGANLTGGGAAPAPAATTPAAGGITKWTSNDGKIIEAEFMGLQGDGVLLKIPSTGVTHIVPLTRLSPESQAQAKAATK